MFIELVTKRVLDCSVSEVLISVEKELHRDETDFFQQAVRMMNHKQISFWLSTSDSQFWLNADRYYSYVKLNKSLAKLEKQEKTALEANPEEEKIE